mmetsp:Transcript_52061/g.125673  ORF Transcript_52061/g.125673 Transcript_52061/m.125673 type:complete len:339 (+) Transcript_52061:2750-3766(+)
MPIFFYHLMDFCFAIFPVCVGSNDPRLVDLGFWLMLVLGLRSRLVDAAAVRMPRVEDDGSYAAACGDFDFVLLRSVPGDSDRELRNSFFFFLFSPSPTLPFVVMPVVVEFLFFVAVVVLVLPRVALGFRPSELFRCGLVVDGIRSERGRRGALLLSARCGRSFDVALLDERFWPLPPSNRPDLPPPPPPPTATPLLLLLSFPFSSILPISLWRTRRDLDVDLSCRVRSVFNKFLALIRRLVNILSPLLFPLFGDSAESALCDLRKFSVCSDNRLVRILPSVVPRFELPFSTLFDRPDITSSAESSLLRLRCDTFPPPLPLELSVVLLLGDLLFLLLVL